MQNKIFHVMRGNWKNYIKKYGNVIYIVVGTEMMKLELFDFKGKIPEFNKELVLVCPVSRSFYLCKLIKLIGNSLNFNNNDDGKGLIFDRNFLIRHEFLWAYK